MNITPFLLHIANLVKEANGEAVWLRSQDPPTRMMLNTLHETDGMLFPLAISLEGWNGYYFSGIASNPDGEAILAALNEV